MGRFLFWVGGVILVAGVCWVAPLVHLRPLGAERAEVKRTVFDATAFVGKFWEERLVKSLDRATEAEVLVAAIRNDAKGAQKKYGRTMGLSSSFYFFVKGTGTVLRVEKNEVVMAVGNAKTEDIILETGNVFGNAARDGTGLLEVNDFPNSREFNDVAAEMNRRIEETVLPGLRSKAVIGATVRFVGCAERSEDDAGALPLRLIPLQAEIQ